MIRSSTYRRWLPGFFLLSGLLLALQGCQDKTAVEQPATERQPAWAQVSADTMPAARHENAFVALEGRLYLIGGRGDRPLNIFDPATGAWTQGAQQPLEIHHMQAVTYNGKIYILGALTGGFPEEPPLEHVLIYDPVSDSWEQGPEIPEHRRRGASGVVIHDNLIYVIGGNTRGHMSGYVAWLDAFDPATGQWRELPDAPHARDHFHAAVIDGQIYAAAGRMSSHDTGESMELTVSPVDVYDIAAERWRTLAEPLPTPRSGTATLAVNGRLVVLGGESMSHQKAHSQVEAYDPALEQWRPWPTLPVGRHGTQATLLGSSLYIAAGSGNRGGGPELNDLWVLELDSP